MAEPQEIAIRKTANKQVIILLHGFSGAAHQTFGMLPAFIAADPALTSWDIYSFGYPTSLAPDITGFWSSDPDLGALSGYFADRLDVGFERYTELAIIAHSMGGLIAQKALLRPSLLDRMRLVMLFGTPSRGLQKARLGQIFKRQVRDMTPDSAFITALRGEWRKRFNSKPPPFQFDVVAGLSDQFVPESSSLSEFSEDHHNRVEGNHLEMVKPTHADTHCVQLVRARLLGNNQLITPPTQDARFPEKGERQPKEIVDQALALELMGDRPGAIRLLQESMHKNYYVAGALAGRYKRMWMADPERNRDDAKKALQIYSDALRGASAAGKHRAAAYNGLNKAFMLLALHNDGAGSNATASEVLALINLIEMAPDKDPWKWLKASLGEAYLYLGRIHEAMLEYEDAAQPLDARERSSMFQQSIWISRLLGRDDIEANLRAIMGRGSFYPG